MSTVNVNSPGVSSATQSTETMAAGLESVAGQMEAVVSKAQDIADGLKALAAMFDELDQLRDSIEDKKQQRANLQAELGSLSAPGKPNVSQFGGIENNDGSITFYKRDASGNFALDDDDKMIPLTGDDLKGAQGAYAGAMEKYGLQLDNYNERVNDLRNQISSLDGEITDLQAQVGELADKIEGQQKNIETMTKQKEAMERQLQAMIDDAKKDASSSEAIDEEALNYELDEVNEEISTLRSEIQKTQESRGAVQVEATGDVVNRSDLDAEAMRAAVETLTVRAKANEAGLTEGNDSLIELPEEVQSRVDRFKSANKVDTETLSSKDGQAALQTSFAEMVGDIVGANPDMIDVNSLVQSVLREAYVQNTEDLKHYASKVSFYNEVKSMMREFVSELRNLRGSLGDANISSLTTAQKNELKSIVNTEQESTYYNLLPEGMQFKEWLNTNEAKGMSLDEAIEHWDSQLQAIGDDAQLANIDLQNMLQKQQQTVQMLSNISKILHDTATAVIRKIG